MFFLKLKGILDEEGRGFPHVRFCDNNIKNYTHAKKILGNTIGKMSNFEDIVLDNAPEFWDGFPYDIYNMDFCGTCLPETQPPFSKTFEAIEKIIESHVTRNHFPFLIFLTIKALDSETNPEAKRQLKRNIDENRRVRDFAAQIDSVIPNIDAFVRDHFVDFILISIPKILAHLAKTKCSLAIKTRAKYERPGYRGNRYCIAKFVFKFTKRPRRTNLSVSDENYKSNIASIMTLSNVLTIDAASATPDVTTSHNELKDYMRTRESL